MLEFKSTIGPDKPKITVFINLSLRVKVLEFKSTIGPDKPKIKVQIENYLSDSFEYPRFGFKMNRIALKYPHPVLRIFVCHHKIS